MLAVVFLSERQVCVCVYLQQTVVRLVPGQQPAPDVQQGLYELGHVPPFCPAGRHTDQAEPYTTLKTQQRRLKAAPGLSINNPLQSKHAKWI